MDRRWCTVVVGRKEGRKGKTQSIVALFNCSSIFRPIGYAGLDEGYKIVLKKGFLISCLELGFSFGGISFF